VVLCCLLILAPGRSTAWRAWPLAPRRRGYFLLPPLPAHWAFLRLLHFMAVGGDGYAAWAGHILFCRSARRGIATAAASCAAVAGMHPLCRGGMAPPASPAVAPWTGAGITGVQTRTVARGNFGRSSFWHERGTLCRAVDGRGRRITALDLWRERFAGRHRRSAAKSQAAFWLHSGAWRWRDEEPG